MHFVIQITNVKPLKNQDGNASVKKEHTFREKFGEIHSRVWQRGVQKVQHDQIRKSDIIKKTLLKSSNTYVSTCNLPNLKELVFGVGAAHGSQRHVKS